MNLEKEADKILDNKLAKTTIKTSIHLKGMEGTIKNFAPVHKKYVKYLKREIGKVKNPNIREKYLDMLAVYKK